ncbi:MAG: hypothetical protein IKS67_01605, partial [Victivallales bacterium]|nr:hypothetical protein [Victivallales bacterium]
MARCVPPAPWMWRGASRLRRGCGAVRPACALKPPVAALMADGSWLMVINGGTPMGLPSPTAGRHHAAYGSVYGRWLMAYGYRRRGRCRHT